MLYLGAVLDSAFALMTTGIVTLYIITVLMLVGALCSLHRSAVYMTVLSIAVGVGYPAAGRVVGYYLVSIHQPKMCNYILIFLYPCTPLSFFFSFNFPTPLHVHFSFPSCPGAGRVHLRDDNVFLIHWLLRHLCRDGWSHHVRSGR